jgi:hypothetical protein
LVCECAFSLAVDPQHEFGGVIECELVQAVFGFDTAKALPLDWIGDVLDGG